MIEELIGAARKFLGRDDVGKNWPVRPEFAFYDALGVNDSALKLLGDAALRMKIRTTLLASVGS